MTKSVQLFRVLSHTERQKVISLLDQYKRETPTMEQLKELEELIFGNKKTSGSKEANQRFLFTDKSKISNFN